MSMHRSNLFIACTFISIFPQKIEEVSIQVPVRES